jgi:magnesium transporter
MAGRSRKRKRQRRLDSIDLHLHELPGTVVDVPDEPMPTIELFAYGPDHYIENTLHSVDEVKQFLGKHPVIWLNVEGLGDAKTIIQLGRIFGVHELALEDAASIHQRAKVDEYDDLLFIIVRMASSHEGHPDLEQLSMFLGPGFVITIQEGHTGDVLDPVRDRIRKGNGHLRIEQADYLMYAILDTVIDGYFPVVESLGDELEKLEDSILEGPDRYTPARVLEMKRDILGVRRAIWPARDVVNILARDEVNLVSQKTRVYLRDCYDHAMRIIDLLETQREMCSDLMDLYLSSVSNRMNEVMKALTVITLLFMPPTLIAGIYGMNFNTKYPLNMPELNWTAGYPFALTLMVVTALCFVRYAYTKGWTRNELDDIPNTFHSDNGAIDVAPPTSAGSKD